MIKIQFFELKNKMEKNISIFFSKLSPIQDKENYLIELSNNNKTSIIPYPQSSPVIISLSPKTDKEIISINVKSKQVSKKHKIIGHGEILVYKKFLSEKPIERYILLFKENIEKNKVKLNNNTIGKIFAQIKLDELSSDKNHYKGIDNIKEHKKLDNEIKKEEVNSISNSEKKENELNSFKIDENDLILYNNLDELLSCDNIFKLKEFIENEKNELPKDINFLKSFNNNLFNQFKSSNEKFSKILLSLSEDNQNLEKKMNEIILKNKNIEEEINKLKIESNKKEEELYQIMKEIKEKNDLFPKKLESIKNKENNFNNELMLKENKETNNQLTDLNDIKDICILIKKFNSLGYGIEEGDLTDSEKQNLNDLLNNFDKEKEKKESIKDQEDILNEDELSQMKDDFELGDKIITLIERDVNDLFSRKLIELVNIDQIDSINYIFSGKIKKKEVSFKLEDNNLICSTGETFTVWLIKNFSL